MKNPAAVKLGKSGGKARAEALTAAERQDIARLGGLARAKKFKAKQNGTVPTPAALPKVKNPAATRRTKKP